MLFCTSSRSSVDLWDLKMVGCPFQEFQGTPGRVPSVLMLCPGSGVLEVLGGAAGILQLRSAEPRRPWRNLGLWRDSACLPQSGSFFISVMF